MNDIYHFPVCGEESIEGSAELWERKRRDAVSERGGLMMMRERKLTIFLDFVVDVLYK